MLVYLWQQNISSLNSVSSKCLSEEETNPECILCITFTGGVFGQCRLIQQSSLHCSLGLSVLFGNKGKFLKPGLVSDSAHSETQSAGCLVVDVV